jgi:hypothetical protein
VQAFSDAGLLVSKPQQANLAMLCAALALSPDCHLSTLALQLPVVGNRESLVQRQRRWLKTAPSWDCAYRPLVQHLFGHWSAAEVALVIDRTDLGDRVSVLTLGVAFGKRLLPLIWRVLPYGSTSAETQIAMLRRIGPYLPPGCRVTFFGDAEFRAVLVQAFCQAQGWHWHVGVKSDVRILTADDRSMALIDALRAKRGQTTYLQQVRLTAQHAFGPVNILAHRFRGDAWPHYWVTDLPADRRAWRRGRKRFWIEPSFRDWKSYGFDLERCQIICPQRLEALLLPIAITTLWMVHIGDWLTRTGRRSLLEAPGRHDYSLFRLGRDFVARARTMNWRVPVGFTVTHPPAN